MSIYDGNSQMQREIRFGPLTMCIKLEDLIGKGNHHPCPSLFAPLTMCIQVSLASSPFFLSAVNVNYPMEHKIHQALGLPYNKSLQSRTSRNNLKQKNLHHLIIQQEEKKFPLPFLFMLLFIMWFPCIFVKQTVQAFSFYSFPFHLFLLQLISFMQDFPH